MKQTADGHEFGRTERHQPIHPLKMTHQLIFISHSAKDKPTRRELLRPACKEWL